MGPTLVILAAGVGRRYGGLKQLEPIGPGGETLMEYSVYDALRAGFERVVLVVRAETQGQFQEAFEAGMARRVPLTYVHQSLADLPAGFQVPEGREKPWGTAQAILSTAVVIDEDFVVINADDFYGAKSFSTLAEFLGQKDHSGPPTFAMLGFRVGDTLTEAGPASRGLCRLDAHGRLESIEEVLEVRQRGDGGVYTAADGSEVIVPAEQLVSMNFWGFGPALFGELRRRFVEFLERHGEDPKAEFLIPEVVQSMVDAGRARVEVLTGTGRWCGVTYPEDRDRAVATLASLIDSGEYPQPLWS